MTSFSTSPLTASVMLTSSPHSGASRGQYATKEDVFAALPQEPEANDASGGTARG